MTTFDRIPFFPYYRTRGLADIISFPSLLAPAKHYLAQDDNGHLSKKSRTGDVVLDKGPPQTTGCEWFTPLMAFHAQLISL
jgi:hypothetical protein